MKVKRYVAPSLQSAISKVKAELGKDAVILHTKRRKRGGFFGLFGREVVEITAAAAEPPGFPHLPTPVLPLANKEATMLTDLQKELSEIKTMVAGLTAGGAVADEVEGDLFKAYHILSAFHNILIQNDVSAENAASLVKKVIANLSEEELQDYGKVKGALVEALAEELDNSSPLSHGTGLEVVALVGPTGVGKTTTVAKLAANFALLENREVAMVTADTYRIAAVEQLRRYAEIIDVPLEVVFSPEEFRQALVRLQDKDVILIDTAGRSQRNIVQLSELRTLLRQSARIKTLLVLSLTTKYRDLLDIVAKFQQVGFDALLFTKLDETTSVGSILNLVKATGKPLTYITTGQNVPDDIESADPLKLAKLILGEK